jgi:hypothetical protein
MGHQAPVSYRILPRVGGQAHRAVAGVEHAASVSLRSVSDTRSDAPSRRAATTTAWPIRQSEPSGRRGPTSSS